MRIPKKIKVAGLDINIRQVPKVDVDGRGYAGAWLSAYNIIEMDKNYTIQQKEVTLIHEIIHVINSNIPEIEVEYLAQILYQVLKDNKLYFDGKDEK